MHDTNKQVVIRSMSRRSVRIRQAIVVYKELLRSRFEGKPYRPTQNEAIDREEKTYSLHGEWYTCI